MARCTICHTKIQRTEAVQECASCQMKYHDGCWNGIGGCATYGCSQAPDAPKAPPAVNTQRGWGDDKGCPNCQARIASSAMFCGCGARFPWADPMTSAEYYEWFEREKARRSARVVILVLFCLSLTGLAAPVVGPIAFFKAQRDHQALTGEGGGPYLALAYGTAAIGLVYILLIVAVILGG